MAKMIDRFFYSLSTLILGLTCLVGISYASPTDFKPEQDRFGEELYFVAIVICEEDQCAAYANHSRMTLELCESVLPEIAEEISPHLTEKMTAEITCLPVSILLELDDH